MVHHEGTCSKVQAHRGGIIFNGIPLLSRRGSSRGEAAEPSEGWSEQGIYYFLRLRFFTRPKNRFSTSNSTSGTEKSTPFPIRAFNSSFSCCNFCSRKTIGVFSKKQNRKKTEKKFDICFCHIRSTLLNQWRLYKFANQTSTHKPYLMTGQKLPH